MHACPGGFAPYAMHEKAEKMKESEDKHCSDRPWNSPCSAVLHHKTEKPDGQVKLEIRCLFCSRYTDSAYALKCKQIFLLPKLPLENGREPIFILLPSQKITAILFMRMRIRWNLSILIKLQINMKHYK